ncbi:hypothetical protein NSMM_570006 [Nitrosomonas mobilis]|uniref:Uncharacterized protein n=1 Tax=Nitrosomonas mobilis TaxID=51642 RepID=A0A1G5SIX4_9PROT|nr:hypothetical protein NSMM_570006 [Nitrosomonas mobilis]
MRQSHMDLMVFQFIGETAKTYGGRLRKQNWRQELESLDRLRVTFAKEGIPLEFLSHYKPYEPFAFLRINDGLSDKF